MTIGDLLIEQARRHPDAIAFIDDERKQKLTFARLEHAVAQAAVWWKAQGINRGDAVLVFVPMSTDLYVALLGLFRIGAVAVFLDPSAGAEHIERCCRRWPPKAFLGIPKAHALRLTSAALRRIPLKISMGCWIPGARRWPRKWSGTNRDSHHVEPGDAALVTFTSGSTGLPKAAVRTHAFLLAQLRALAPGIALEPGEVDFATLPVFVLANLAAGVTTVLPNLDLRRPGKVDAARVFLQIETHQVDRVTASPAFFERLLAHGQSVGRTLPSLRKIYTGGAPVFPRVLEALGQLAPHARIEAVYGSTEAEPIAHIRASDVATEDVAAMKQGQGLLAGRPVPEIRLAILPDVLGKPLDRLEPETFARAILPSGEIGEIVVAGDHVLPGYLGGVGDEETKFRVGEQVWHRTGDAGCIDARGRLWLHGRCAARIDDSRGRFYPFGVECVAMTFPAVRKAAMVKHHDERCLIVAASEDATLTSKLLAATRWAQVDRVLLWPELPTDQRHNAKIDYTELRKRLDAGKS